jgi:hypothetical protein
MLNKILMIALLVGPTLAAAQDVRETPTLNLYAWAERNTSGNVDAKTAFGGGLSATMPIFIGKEALLRGTTDVHVTQAAGTTFDPTNLQTFGTSAEFMFGLERKISYVSVGGKDVRFGLVGPVAVGVAVVGARAEDVPLREPEELQDSTQHQSSPRLVRTARSMGVCFVAPTVRMATSTPRRLR